MADEVYMARERQYVEDHLLYDTCEIWERGDDITIDDLGVETPGTATKKTYTPTGGSPTTTIPCRIDPSRAFRPERLDLQEVNVNEFVLHLPFSVDVLPDERIVVNSSRELRSRKVITDSSLSLTREVLVTEMEFEHGAESQD